MEHDDASPRLLARGFATWFVVLLVLSCVPLLLTALPPLLDYPNHLARMHLLPSLAPDSPLQRYVAVRWAPLPNLAMDGVVPLLARVMPLEWAAKLFVAAIFLMLAGGTAALNRVLFGRWSSWSLLAFLLLYTRLLLWGFVGYLFGCGLALLALSAWIALRERSWLLRVVLGTIFALAIYLAHLLAFGIYAVMMACYELGQVWQQRKPVARALRDLAIGGVPFLPALMLMAGNSSTGRIIYANPLRKLDLLFSVFDDYSRPFDVACFIIAVLAVGFVFWRRWVRLAPEIILPLIGLVFVYLAMPTQLFTAAGVERRIPMMIFLVLVGGSAWQARFARAEAWFMAGAAAMFLARFAMIALVWHNAGRLYASLLPAFDSLPRGACLAVAFDKDSIAVQKAPLTHFPAMALLRRDDFVTTLFAYPDQQPIALQPLVAEMVALLPQDGLWWTYVDGRPSLPPPAQSALAECGYVAFAGTRAFTLKNAAGLQPLFLAPRLQLYRVAAAAK